MSLEQKVMVELKEAMKSKNEGALRGLRAIKSAILLAKTEKGGGEGLSEEVESKLLQKLVKQRKDSLEIYKEQGRADLAKTEEEEIAVIEKFLPEQMDESEVRATLEKIVADSGASGPQDMGKVMGTAMKALSGKADGKMISSIVRELLTA